MKKGIHNTEHIKKETYDNYIVAKSNKLVNANFDLRLNELKIMIILASRVQPDENRFNQYAFKASELADLLQITHEAMYKELPKITRSLMRKELEIKSDAGDYYLQVNLLSSALYLKGQGIVVLEFSNSLAPYLFNLKQNFTKYRLKNILALNSKYSIRMYEIFRCHYQHNKPFIITVDDLRKQLQLIKKSYDSYGIIKSKVVDIAVKEINEMTDLTVEWEPIKAGRKVESLCFYIQVKTPEEMTNTQRKIKGKRASKTSTEPQTKETQSTKAKTKPSSTKKGAKKEEPFVDYLQTVVKQKTKKHLPKKDARLIAELVNEDMSKFGPVLPHLNENIANPTGFIRDFFTNPDKYQSGKKPIREERIPEHFNTPAPSYSEEEAAARVKRMKELQAGLLNPQHSQLSIPL